MVKRLSKREQGRRKFLLAATSTVGAAGFGAAVWPFLRAWQPSARARASGAPVRVEIGQLMEGQLVTFGWRGRPIFVVKQDAETMAGLKTPESYIADPTSDASEQPEYAKNWHRSRREDVTVLVGLCTHLGCSPKFVGQASPQPFDNAWKGGFFCPCHGSKFDLLGRVYSGVPAPTNLSVPPHYFEGPNTIVVGIDEPEV